jgi:hypothetical protein
MSGAGLLPEFWARKQAEKPVREQRPASKLVAGPSSRTQLCDLANSSKLASQ